MTAAWPPASSGAMNAKSPPASSRARSLMRWSTSAWSSVEVSSRPIASSASASCRRRSPSAAARSRSTATAARSAMLLHSAASVAPSAGPSRRPTSRAPIGSPAWSIGVATQEVRAASRRGSVAQALSASTSVESTGALAREPGRPGRRRPGRAPACPPVPRDSRRPRPARRRSSPSTRRKTAARSATDGGARDGGDVRHRLGDRRRLQQTAKGSQGLPLARAHVVPRSRHGSAPRSISRSARAPSRATRSASTRETPPTSTIRRGIAGDTNRLAPRGSPWSAPEPPASRLFAPTGG